MLKFTVASLAIVASFAVTSASSSEKDAIKAAAIPLLQACGKELEIPEEDIMAVKESKKFEDLDPCFYACFFKKIGILNDKGLFDPAAAIEQSTKYVSEEDKLKKVSEVVNTCTAVNDEDVSDTEGCDRAKLLLICFINEKHAFLSA